MFLVGLTGGIASGKSTVAKILNEELGCPILDADKIAREVVEPGKAAYNQIRQAFGEDVLLSTGSINREKLGQIIFNDVGKRRQLNAIVHPEIKKEMLLQVVRLAFRGHQFAVLDIPLLFETKQMLPFLSFTIVVFCNEDQQLNRLMHRNDLDEHAARMRIESQMSMEEKCKLCSYTIDNSGSLDVTKRHIKRIHNQLQAPKKHLLIRFAIFSLLTSIVSGVLYICRWLDLI